MLHWKKKENLWVQWRVYFTGWKIKEDIRKPIRPVDV